MPKPNPLTQGLEQQPRSAPARVQTSRQAVATRESAPNAKSPARSGRVLIGGHFAPEVQTELKILAARERTTIQALLAEAINTVFAKRGKPEIADMQHSDT
jgi:hypothetical protein